MPLAVHAAGVVGIEGSSALTERAMEAARQHGLEDKTRFATLNLFEVDAQCRPIGRDGAPTPGLRIVGPPSAGSLGDPLGVPFIAPQIRRMIPGILAELR